MSENKTKPTDVDPAAFIEQVESEQKRKDCYELVALMKKITGKPARMWGSTIVGFGRCHYTYESGREGDMPLAGFSPRKSNLVVYLWTGLEDKRQMSRLGKHKAGKSCLYIKKLDDIDRELLGTLVKKSVEVVRRLYPCD